MEHHRAIPRMYASSYRRSLTEEDRFLTPEELDHNDRVMDEMFDEMMGRPPGTFAKSREERILRGSPRLF